MLTLYHSFAGFPVSLTQLGIKVTAFDKVVRPSPSGQKRRRTPGWQMQGPGTQGRWVLPGLSKPSTPSASERLQSPLRTGEWARRSQRVLVFPSTRDLL